MTIKELLAFCRDNGYEGDNTRASLKDWLANDGSFLEFVGKDRKSLSFDALWPEKVTKGITLSVSKNGSEPDTVEVVEAGGEAPQPEMGTEEAKTRRHDTEAKAAKGIDGMLASQKAFRVARPEVSAYKYRIAKSRSGGLKSIADRAVFDDVEKAEVAAATMRMAIAQCHGIYDYGQKARDQEIVGKGAIEGVNIQGGALVPKDFIPELIVLLNEYGAARQLCNFRTVSREVIELPRRTADPTVSWTGEAAASSDQDPAYDNVQVTAKKLQGIMYVSSELLNDAALSIVDDMFNGFANGIALKEDNAFFLGDGTSTYGGVTGFLNAIGTAGVSTSAGNTWSAMTDAELQAFLGKIPSYAWSGSVKLTCTPNAFFSIINRVSRGMGGVTYTESQTGVVKPVYNGYPVVYNNVMASASAVSTKSVLAGDFDMAAKAIEVSGSLEFATSEHYRFANDQLTLRARERVGITVHDAGDSTNAGPVVAFATTS